MRTFQRQEKLIWALSLAGTVVCWWLQPPQLPHVLPLLLLFLLATLTMAVPVGRLGARTVRFGGSVVLFVTLLYGAMLGSAVGLVSGWLAQSFRRDRREILAYAPAVAMSAQCSGLLYRMGTVSASLPPTTWQGWARLLVALLTFSAARVVLLWWMQGRRRTHLRSILRAEAIVDAVTLPAIMAALFMYREWGWLSVLALCAMGAVGLFSARAFIEAHLAHRQIRALQTMHQRLIAHLHPDHLLQDLGSELRRLLPFERMSLWSYARQESHLQIVGAYPQEDRSEFPAYVGAEGMLSQALDIARPLVLTDAHRQIHPELAELFRGHLFIIPLTAHDYRWGLLVLERPAHHEPFTRADYQLVRVLVEHLAILLENMRLYRQTMDLAVRDGLTGLLNHRRLHERMKEELSRSLRYHHPMALLMIDVDYFKRYNDTYGHQQGDELLRILAETLQYNVRQTDIVGRYGGEEFAIILPETDKQSAVVLAQRLCDTVARTPFPGVPGGPPTRCTISVGVASYPEDGLTVSELVAAADSALYRAKRYGKNRVVMAS